jgi:hypothetical protein
MDHYSYSWTVRPSFWARPSFCWLGPSLARPVNNKARAELAMLDRRELGPSLARLGPARLARHFFFQNNRGRQGADRIFLRSRSLSPGRLARLDLSPDRRCCPAGCSRRLAGCSRRPANPPLVPPLARRSSSGRRCSSSGRRRSSSGRPSGRPASLLRSPLLRSSDAHECPTSTSRAR